METLAEAIKKGHILGVTCCSRCPRTDDLKKITGLDDDYFCPEHHRQVEQLLKDYGVLIDG